MHSKCEITGIVVNYNSMRYVDIVERSIESLINISTKPIIFVDNSSVDGSYEHIVKKFEGDIVPLRLPQNFGYAGAIDLAYMKFHNYLTDIFFIANNDLIITDISIIRRIYRIMEKDKSVASGGGVLLSANQRINSAGFIVDKLGLFHNLCENMRLDECEIIGSIFNTSFISGGFTLFRKKYIRVLPDRTVFPIYGFMYLDDIITGLYFSQLGFKNVVVGEPLGIHFESLSLVSERKAFLLGRALAIQRRIVDAPLRKLLIPYKKLIAIKHALRSRTLRTSFNRGWKVGEKEYLERKSYWDRYRININIVLHYNSSIKTLKRILKFIQSR